ncbi:MAG: hypothetical protein ACRD3V_32980, partial [Vicinamibacteria bacterium]
QSHYRLKGGAGGGKHVPDVRHLAHDRLDLERHPLIPRSTALSGRVPPTPLGKRTLTTSAETGERFRSKRATGTIYVLRGPLVEGNEAGGVGSPRGE